MPDKYALHVQLTSGEIVLGEALCSSFDEHRVLVVSVDGEKFRAVEDDFFDALCSVRRQFDSRGMMAICYGASRNVFPSGMSRTGGGLIAYRMELGQSAKDLVNIFDYSPDLDICSVDEQQAFFDRWIASLGSR